MSENKQTLKNDTIGLCFKEYSVTFYRFPFFIESLKLCEQDAFFISAQIISQIVGLK